MRFRQLKVHERNLMKYLLMNSLRKESDSMIDSVEELQDGNMGCILFVSSNANRAYYSDLVQVEYIDVDNVQVIITLTIDNHQELFELEFWKVNYEKLVRYPNPKEVLVRTK